MNLYLYVEDKELRAKYADYLASRRKTDSGIDIFCPFNTSVPAETTCRIPLGIFVASRDYLGNLCPTLLLARSSISKTHLRLSNSIGLIDSGYRGEVCAAVDNINGKPYEVTCGDRLFQICSHDFMPFTKIQLVDRLEDLPQAQDNRGSGGFGSTGK